MPQSRPDPYVYTGTDVLRNHYNITSSRIEVVPNFQILPEHETTQIASRTVLSENCATANQ